MFKQVTLYQHTFLTAGEDSFNRLIFEHISKKKPDKLLLAHYNLHCLFLASRNTDMLQYMKSAKHIWIDGMPIIWILRRFGYNIPYKWRLTFLDWQNSFFNIANVSKTKIFLLGSNSENIELAHKNLSTQFPLIVFDTHHGYLEHNHENSKLNEYVLEKINSFNPDILMVGMGMPNQETWIGKYNGQLNAKVIMPLGGYFDYIAGVSYIPPRWTGKIGMEWFFRLVNSPSRLGYRYLIEPWCLAYLLMYKYFTNRS